MLFLALFLIILYILMFKNPFRFFDFLHFTGNDIISLLSFCVFFLNINFYHRYLDCSLQIYLSERMNLIPSFLLSLPLFPSPPLLVLHFSLGIPSLSDGFSVTSTFHSNIKAKTSFHSLLSTSDLFSLIKQAGKEADPSRRISWKKIVLFQVLVLWFCTAGK